MKKFYIFVFIFFVLVCNSFAQQVNLTGKVINPDEKPIEKVLVYLGSNPSLHCYSDSIGYFSLNDMINTSVPETRQDEIISFENGKLSLYANNQSVSVDVITLIGVPIMNILNLNKNLGTIGLYPEAYISELPKAIYIARARAGNTVRSFKIQNIIPSGFPQGITQYGINSIADKYSNPQPRTKSGVTDTLILVHDFYKSRKMALDTYSKQLDTIHLFNFADYSMAEGFEPSVTYWYNGYANFTDILSEDSVEFIIEFDTLSILKGDLKVITIPVDKIEGLENSISFISGLHFEPSGIQFFQPVQVYVLMKEPIPDSLVVFQYTDQGETYFIPHKNLSGRSISFYINHFSSIGIGIGDIHPPTENPESFTTSDQFLSYIDEYLRYYESIGIFGNPPMELFTTWYNNVVVPMISKINTWEDFGAALDEFLIIAQNCEVLGMGHWSELPFWDSAREMFSEKMMEIWNACVVEYDGLQNNCLKSAILDIALQILELNAVMGGTICPDLTFSDLNSLGNGGALNLANKLEFSTKLIVLDVDSSYAVQYSVKSISGAAITEPVSWSSSDPSVATIDANGKGIALKPGETIITGRICDIYNTVKVEVGVDCENQYCANPYDSCYSGKYHCSVFTRYFKKNTDPICGNGEEEYKDWEIMVGELGFNKPGYYKRIQYHGRKNRPSISGCFTRYELKVLEDKFVAGAFMCWGTNEFRYWPVASFPTNKGYFIGDVLVFDVEYDSGDEGIKTTQFRCSCTDK
jgi:hypothetical protein